MTVTCTTSTRTLSLYTSDLVRSVSTTRPPPTSVATARTWCSATAAPASQSHSYGGDVNTQICRPSTKKLTAEAAAAGSMRARNSVGPLRYASAVGDRILIWAVSSGAC